MISTMMYGSWDGSIEQIRKAGDARVYKLAIQFESAKMYGNRNKNIRGTVNIKKLGNYLIKNARLKWFEHYANRREVLYSRRKNTVLDTLCNYKNFNYIVLILI